MTPARWLILLGCIVLFCAGLMHVFAYRLIVPVLMKAGLEGSTLGAVKACWLIFSLEMILLSPAFVWINRFRGTGSLLLFLALIPVVDAILMYHFVGLFIGFYIVAAGALFLLVGAWLERHA